jgi:DNA-binding NarL/FixJ family response regulator
VERGLIADDRFGTSLSTKRASRGTVTVCLVEDYAPLRELLCDLLVESGAHLLSAVGTLRDGEAAISYHRPDVAVIDNRLPDGRGVDLIRTLAQTAPSVALLLHSGTATHDDASEALQAGAAGIILKSIRGYSLIEAIQISAGRHRAAPGRVGVGASDPRAFRPRPSFRPRS